MISISSAIIDALITKHQDEFNRHTKNLKAALNRLLLTPLNADEKDYINELKNIGKKLIVGTPVEIEQKKILLDELYIFKKKFTDDAAGLAEKERQIKFKNSILAALAYETRRSDFYPKYFRDLGIKACVYCNSQLCVTVEDHNGNLVAKFQVDHYLPKSEYPCFSVSLFNLYPVCSSCNNKKGAKNLTFLLYDNAALAQATHYSFELKDKDDTVAEYLTNRDAKIISVGFKEPPAPVGESFNEVFAISGIYDTQIDIVEELILKSHIYSGVYRELIEDYMVDIYGSKDVLDRLIMGTYVEERDIHKRPMAKFTQDIARQLKLIK